MENTNYQSAAKNVSSLGSVVPKQLVECTSRALSKLNDALGGDVSGYVAKRLHMTIEELGNAMAAEQVDGVALAMYNIEKRSQSVIIGDQTGIGKGRQAAAMIRYGLLSGYLPIFFTDRYTLFSDMYRDCKALGIKDARPLVVNEKASVVDFDSIIEEPTVTDSPDEIWSPIDEDDDPTKYDADIMQLYQKQYEVVYKAPKKKILQCIFNSGDVPSDAFDYLMITYSQLKDAKRDATRLNFLHQLCIKHRVLFIFDEAHRSSSVSAGNLSVITQGINSILVETPQTQCIFLSATFAKRPESFITFMRRTALSALATENTLEKALLSGGVPMQEYVSSTLAAEGQMIRREHSNVGLPAPVYTYLDEDLPVHGELFDKVMFYFREIVKLSSMVNALVMKAQMFGLLTDFICYPTRAQLFYINKITLLSLKAQIVAQTAVEEVRQGRCVVIGMSDTLECILKDVEIADDGSVRGDISSLLLRLMDKTIRSTSEYGEKNPTIYDLIDEEGLDLLKTDADEIKNYCKYITNRIHEDVFHLPVSPIDVIRQLIIKEQFISPEGNTTNIRFEECTGRSHQLEYLSPEGCDDFINAQITSRRKRHSNLVFNDFQNNKLDVILINACGAIGASAHAISTAEVPDDQVRQRKMLIVQNDLDVNIDLQKRGRINRTGQRADLPPLYEYIITAIPSEKRLNMMLRAKLRSLSANTAAWQDHDKDQADFVDISNKYGNKVASDFICEHEELGLVLGLKGTTTASILLARIAMLSVSAQQDIVDDIMAAYTNLETELRHINQWDLERDYRDFEAEFVKEEIFTSAKTETKLGGCSYLTSYKCKQKTFPYSYEALMSYCNEAKAKFGNSYNDNPTLQQQVKNYYSHHSKRMREHYDERRRLLHDDTKRILVNYCEDEALAETWMGKAQTASNKWSQSDFADVNGQKKAKQIMNKLISFSNEFNHLIEREKEEREKYVEERKRLIHILSLAEIGKGYSNISCQIASEGCPDKVIAVLRDIRFGRDDRTRFLPSRVELIFALSAVYTEIHINLVHSNKWSNYGRLVDILESEPWRKDQFTWEHEIALNNNKIVERKIITGNILGSYVHPAIANLNPRFISFSVKNNTDDNMHTQIGLLLPLDESKIREALKCVSLPLHEGVKYANMNSVYTISGIGVTFTFLPYRVYEAELRYVICVQDKHSTLFETDKRFDDIRSYFNTSSVSSIYERDAKSKTNKRKPLIHYQTDQLLFDSEAFQAIIQTLSQLDAVIIVPRDQLTYREVKEFISRSERDDNAPWEKLNWKNDNEIPMPPVKEKILMRISAPIVANNKTGRCVSQHSAEYNLAKEIMTLNGLSLKLNSTRDALRRSYFKIIKSDINSWYERDKICRELRGILENGSKFTHIEFSDEVKKILQKILDSEYIDTISMFMTRFNDEMLFLSPKISEAKAFLDDMPCSEELDNIRKTIQDYIDGRTDVIKYPQQYELYRKNRC